MWRLYHLSIIGRSILSGTPQFVCLKSLEKFEKRIIAIRALIGSNHPPYSPDLATNDFSLCLHIKKKMRGQRFSPPEVTVEVFKNHALAMSQSKWKTNTNDGRTSKNSEYRYA